MVVYKGVEVTRVVFDLFWSKVAISNDGCWEWTGALNSGGYGQSWAGVSGNGRRVQVRAHKLAYVALVGAFDDTTLQLDHLCRNRRCVNPRHLEPVTGRVNTLRGKTITARNATKTHCDRGHEFSGDNLMPQPDGSRACRECGRARAREYQRRKRCPGTN